jgi:NhaP-type Na+/H+ or K+/H+ antiporter
MLVILVLRRIPSLLILYRVMPEVSNWREALFCGHFGPVSTEWIFLTFSPNSLFQIGVGAIFIATLAQSRLDVPQDPPSSQQDILAIALQPIVSFVVLGSILTRMSNCFLLRERLFMFTLLYRWPFHTLLFCRPPYFDHVSLDSRAT